MGHEDAESGRAGTQSTCTGLLGYRGHLLRLELICLGYVVCDWPEMSTGATDLCEALTVAPRARWRHTPAWFREPKACSSV